MNVRKALCDSFDTATTVNELNTLMKECNTYLQQPADKIKTPLVLQVSRFVFKILKCFGVYEEGDLPSLLGEGEE